MKSSFFALSVFLALGTSFCVSAYGGDVKSGEAVFRQRCQMCHSQKKGGPNRLGPDLFDIMGKKAGEKAGFRYSRPLQNSKIVWNDANMKKWLNQPAAMVPGNRMSFAGLRNPKQVDDLIAYLHSLK